MKKRKRFRKHGGRRTAARQQRLSKTARELYKEGGLDTWADKLAPREAISAPEDAGDAAPWVGTADDAQQGVVVAIASGLAWVITDLEDPAATQQPLRCQLPSAIARDQKQAIAVGDQVRFAAHGDEHRLLEVLDRRTFLARPDPLNPRQQRVVAANIDLVVHLASVRSPPLRPALIDRYLIAIQQGGADAVLCINKIDLISDAEREPELAVLDGYRDMLPIIPCSTTTGEGLEQIRRRLRGTTSVVVGHSGVGKSSLINALDASVSAAVGAVSETSGVGRHTTTGSNLYTLAGEIRLIDTPGIREFGLFDLDAQALPGYFPDFEQHAAGCHFSNCTHSHEPRCAVRDAVREGAVPEARYATYLRILASLDPI